MKKSFDYVETSWLDDEISEMSRDQKRKLNKRMEGFMNMRVLILSCFGVMLLAGQMLFGGQISDPIVCKPRQGVGDGKDKYRHHSPHDREDTDSDRNRQADRDEERHRNWNDRGHNGTRH